MTQGITVQQSNHLKAIAILLMVFLHLFNTLDYQGRFEPLIFIGAKPLVYYLSLFGDACVPIFAFVTGYGLMVQFQNNNAISNYYAKTKQRLWQLYKNYWLIIIIFPILIGSLLHFDGYPGSWMKILGNVSGLQPSYNGAWWFFTVYVLYALSAPLWMRIVQKVPLWMLLPIGIAVYIVSFYVRVYVPNQFSNALLIWLQQYGALFFCTLMQFLIGAMAVVYKWPQRWFSMLQQYSVPQWLRWLLIPLLVLLHAIIPNFIIAPILAFAFIMIWLSLKVPNKVLKFLDVLSPHATNIWLTHMFFYMLFFPTFIYSFKWVPVIYVVLLLICIACSVVINYVLNNVLVKKM